MKKEKTIKAYAVICNQQGFLVAHCDFAGAVRQMKEIRMGSHESQLKCTHKVKEIRVLLPQ